ncbi:MAG: hypothetical protein IJ711_10405 [Lachnospiraceae bacterium]|nr:hypothetical protein [Lachnospiraceae bacterium]
MSKQTLLKFGYMPMTEASARVIDTNEKMEERIKQLRQKAYEDPSQFEEAQFPNQLEASEVARLLADDEEPGEEGFSEGIQAQQMPDAHEEAERILQDAEQRARQILEDAQAEAENMKNSAYQAGLVEGKKDGREAGRIEAMTEMENAKAELDQRRHQMNAEYEQRLAEMEPMLIDTLCDIYEHVLHASLIVKKDIVVQLLADTIRKVEGCKDFIVHVSRGEYEQVKERKEELLEATAAAAATVEVIEDYSLSEGECMVETENGIYDCSLDVQLAALREQLMLLSYQKE